MTEPLSLSLSHTCCFFVGTPRLPDQTPLILFFEGHEGGGGGGGRGVPLTVLGGGEGERSVNVIFSEAFFLSPSPVPFLTFADNQPPLSVQNTVWRAAPSRPIIAQYCPGFFHGCYS